MDDIQELEVEYAVLVGYHPIRYSMVLLHVDHMAVDRYNSHLVYQVLMVDLKKYVLFNSSFNVYIYVVDIGLPVRIDWFAHWVHNQKYIVHIDHLDYYLDNSILKKKIYRLNERICFIHTEHFPVSRSHWLDRWWHNDWHDQHWPK